MSRRTVKKTWVGIWVAVAVMIGLGIYLVTNYAGLKDWAMAMTYTPSAEMSQISEKIELTDAGELIYKASWPELYSEDFDNYCNSMDKDAAVLGCYANGKIYIYNVEDAELDGIREATAAHEMLHAVWERLPGYEKDGVLEVLNKVYQTQHEKLEIVDTYNPTAQASELYARVGTELKELPKELEEHFAKYFEDRAAVVDFYEKYAAKFSELDNALDAAMDEMERLESEILAGKSDYETRGAAFEADVEEFNACADRVGCFADLNKFYARRGELVAEQEALNGLYAKLSGDIARYNELVEEYNANLLARKKLNQMVNSKERKENL